ncbi:hypothetical protein SANTM175S_05910 [Streptomyces antimycoticus]
MAQRTAQPFLGAVLGVGRQGVPGPRRGQPQAQGHGRGLHHGLAVGAVMADHRPGLGVVAPGGAGAAGDARGVALQEAVLVLARGPGGAEGGEEEGAGEPFEPVGAHPGLRWGSGQVDQALAGGGVAEGGVQHAVRGGLPVGAGVAGVGAEGAVVGGEEEGELGHGGVGLLGTRDVRGRALSRRAVEDLRSYGVGEVAAGDVVLDLADGEVGQPAQLTALGSGDMRGEQRVVAVVQR